MKKEAVRSKDRNIDTYFPVLGGDTKPKVLFIGINPSTAGEKEDAPLLISVSITLKVGDMEKC